MRIVLMMRCLLIPLLLPLVALAAPTLPWKVIATRPHDATAFTQGLVIEGDQLIEGTGLYGDSRLIVRDLASGKVLHSTRLPDNQFGEGVAVVGNRIIQLTWRNGIAHVFDRRLNPLGRFRLSNEGWGLTTDGIRLIRSDGSSLLRFHDLQTYVETGAIRVTDDGLEIDMLNELEFVDGLVYANVWQSERIAVVDPDSGHVLAWLDLSGLADRFQKPIGWNAADAVLNGIAVMPVSGHLLVTGKQWPLLFELAVDHRLLKRRDGSIKR